MKDGYKHKRKDLKNKKRIVMKKKFKSSDERKNVSESFKREFRSLKRSEKNEISQNIKKEFGV